MVIDMGARLKSKFLQKIFLRMEMWKSDVRHERTMVEIAEKNHFAKVL